MANSRDHLGARLGAIWCQKRSEDAFSSIRCHFGSILEGFWVIVDGFLMLLFRTSTPFQHKFFNVSFTKSHTMKKTKRRTTKRTVQKSKTFKGLVESALALWICSSSSWTRIWHPSSVWGETLKNDELLMIYSFISFDILYFWGRRHEALAFK